MTEQMGIWTWAHASASQYAGSCICTLASNCRAFSTTDPIWPSQHRESVYCPYGSICQFMYSAILISLYTLFKYAWVIKQFLLESGKKSIKKKNLRQSEHTECCPDELSIVSFILPGHHHLSNCYRMILLIHKVYMYQY